MRPAVRALFLDIGGVVLTDGWDHRARKRAAAEFGLEWPELEARHRLVFELHEEGRLTLDEYLEQLVFYRRRRFTRGELRRFMFAQSKPHPRMIGLIARLKERYGFKVVAVNNEARELNAYRIREFQLGRVVDFFVSSCFVQLRKPDAAIFRLALDAAQVRAGEAVYIDNTPLFVHVAEGLGIRGLVHGNYGTTRAKLASLGLDAA